MSLYGVTEILVHLHSFRNIDLTNQGLYQIRIRISDTDKQSKKFAVPYFFQSSKENEDSMKKEEKSYNLYNLISPHLNETGNEYSSKSFYIRFSDEEVEIDDFCYFRLEVPLSKVIIDTIYNIDFELYYSDSLYSISKDKNSLASQSQLISDAEFKLASCQTVLVNFDRESYIESFLPIIFNENFSSIVCASILMMNIDYRLRVSNPVFLIEEEDPKKKKITSEKTAKIESNTNKPLINMFCEKEMKSVLDEDVINQLYDSFVISLIKNYKQIKSKYTKYTSLIIEDSMKSECSYFSNLNPLSIFAEEDDKEIVCIDENAIVIDYKLVKLSDRIICYDSDYIANRLLNEISNISAQLYQIWHKYIDFIRFFPKNYNFIVSHEYYSKYQEDLSKFVKRTIMTSNESTNYIIPIENNIGEVNKSQVKEIRDYLSEYFIRSKMEILNQMIKPSQFPIIFEETYLKQPSPMDNRNMIFDNDNISNLDDSFDNSSKKYSPSLHLIILVHGFQGNSYDMRLIKNNISQINPSCVFLSSTSNQDDTDCDIDSMGVKLANEILTFLKDWYNGVIFKKISFIGHSLGGLIIRASLPHLKEYSSKFHMYLSLSTPHLGFVLSTSKIIDAGIWFLKTWKKSVCLDQLSMTDHKNVQETFLYKLASYEGLNWFNNFILVSSHQDYYTPYESTRIQICKNSDGDDDKMKIFQQMANSILSRVKKESFKRLDINFIIPEKNIDSFIGRTAHIQFLENQNFMKIIFYYYKDLLK